MVYDVSGGVLSNIYGIDRNQLEQAYDINGNPLLDDSSLVVMSYNVQSFSGINGNESMQDGILDTYKPNIIGLQEVGSSISALGQRVLSDYTYKELGVQSNKTCLASKIQLSNVTASFFNDSGSGAGYQKGYFTKNGKTICWVNVHLASSSYETSKIAQAEETFNLVQNEEYFIITGDFNTVCKSVNDAEYTSIMKQFVDAGYNVANCSPEHGFIDTWTRGSSASGTWYPHDHVITSANIDMDTVIVDTTKIDVTSQTGQSIDHLPIVAYLTIT